MNTLTLARSTVAGTLATLLLSLASPSAAAQSAADLGEDGPGAAYSERRTATGERRAPGVRLRPVDRRPTSPPPTFKQVLPGDLDGLRLAVCNTSFAMVTFRRTDGQALSRTCIDELPGGVDPSVAQRPVIDIAEVARSVPWPDTNVYVSPKVFGVVNMETWAWHDPDVPRELSVEVSVDDLVTGQPVTLRVDASIEGWCHRFDDERGERPRFVGHEIECPARMWTTHPGEDDEFGFGPRHVYEERQFTTLSVEQRWVGTATLVDGGVLTWPLGPVTVTHQRDYQVNEIISVLR